MIPISIQVNKSKVSIKEDVGLQQPVQWITQENFAPEAPNMVGR